MIEAVEIEIIDEAKKALGAAVSVRPYSANPSVHLPPNQRGEVLVRYNGSDPGDRTGDGRAQDRTMKYELVLVFRDLRSPEGAQGAYSTLEKLRSHFFGMRLSVANGYCQIGRDGFVGESNGVWQWSVSLSFDTVVMSKKLTEEEAVLKEVASDG